MPHPDKVEGWSQAQVLADLADLKARMGTAETDLNTDDDTLAAFETRVAAIEGHEQETFTELADISGRVAALEQQGNTPVDLAALGVCPLDSFTGSDDDRMTAALSYVGAQTYKPTLVLSNRAHSFNKTYPLGINGLRISGPLGGMAREFGTTNLVHCPPSGLFSVVAGAKDFAISGLSFTGGGQWLQTTSNILSDADITECGFVGFQSVVSCKILRCNFDRWYVNTANGTQLSVGGSDSSLFMSGNSFMSGGTMPTGMPFIRLGSLSQTRIGAMYLTPTNGYGLNIDQGSDAEGLEFFGWRQTAYGQNPPTGPKGAGIRIRNGQAVTFHGGVLFNANTDGTAKGDIECWGGVDHVFEDFQFVGSHEGFQGNVSAPAIWTAVPIVVRSPRAVGGRPKVLQQATAGLIQCDDPTWQIVTAA